MFIGLFFSINIDARYYSSYDRYKNFNSNFANYLEDNFNTDKYFNVRDDEKTKNQDMMIGITKSLKHLKTVPLIITANPSELLVKVIHDELGWGSVYGMQMMLDNTRISNIVNLPKSEYLCIGEHGNPVPILYHLKEIDNNIYDKINIELSSIVSKIHHDYKGIPPLIEAKKSLDYLIDAICYDKELNCVFTSYNEETGTGFGKPFKVKGLNFIEQKIPALSQKEKLLLEETNKRLINKWGGKIA